MFLYRRWESLVSFLLDPRTGSVSTLPKLVGRTEKSWIVVSGGLLEGPFGGNGEVRRVSVPGQKIVPFGSDKTIDLKFVRSLGLGKRKTPGWVR